MEINVPTAAPFFSGLPNQIMYCISTPNPHIQNWNAHQNFNSDQKKIENQHVVAPTTTQYYYSASVPQAHQPPNNDSVNINGVNNNFEDNKPNKPCDERDRNFQCTVVSVINLNNVNL